VVHVTNSGSTTWHGFAEAIAKRLGSSVGIRPTTSDRFPRPARRPANSVLSGERYRTITGESLPHWEEALGDYLARRALVRRGIPA
jgi:dTDP-4-dehydrorhamnose reductase